MIKFSKQHSYKALTRPSRKALIIDKCSAFARVMLENCGEATKHNFLEPKPNLVKKIEPISDPNTPI